MDETLAQTTTAITLAGEACRLHPHAALYWERADTLVVSDLHLGKATHFRRHGMAVPQYVQDETLDKLAGLLLDFRPGRLLMLGDLFHSDYNEEWEDFGDLVLGFRDSGTAFELVPGNHDRLTRHQFDRYGITVHAEPHLEGPFAFSHHPYGAKELEQAIGPERAAQGYYNLAGHVHPAVRLYGRGDRLKLPCFFLGRAAGLMPAFGAFTGHGTVSPRRGDRVYVMTGDRVVAVG